MKSLYMAVKRLSEKRNVIRTSYFKVKKNSQNKKQKQKEPS